MKTKRFVSILLGGMAVVVLAFVGSCSYVSYERSVAFEKVNLSDTEEEVAAAFGGRPSYSERGASVFNRYATQPCRPPCDFRIWYENRLSLDTEAWSIGIDQDGRVVEKTRWTSS